MPKPIKLNRDDVRTGLAIWLECERLHERLHAAQADFGRWANAMGTLYNVPPNHVIGDPTQGFVPAPEVQNGG